MGGVKRYAENQLPKPTMDIFADRHVDRSIGISDSELVLTQAISNLAVAVESLDRVGRSIHQSQKPPNAIAIMHDRLSQPETPTANKEDHS